MGKIPKNLSDTAMVAGYKETITFENLTDDYEEAPVRRAPRPDAKKSGKDFNSSFLTPELQEQVGKALLELKLKLYKEGIVDYKIKVAQQDRQVILTAVPVSPASPSKPEKKPR